MTLNDRLESVFRLTPVQKRALGRLNLETVKDLLFYFPTRYSDISEIKFIKDLIPGDMATVYGEISKTKDKESFPDQNTNG